MELNNRINEYNTNINMLFPILKDKNVPTKCKTIIYTTILRPILTYGSEAWSLTTKTESQIQAAEMRVLRMIRGVTRLDKMRNTQIREDLHVISILKFVEKNKLRWYGHVKRMNNNRYPNKYLNWTPHGKRPVGRPRMRWIQGIKSALVARGTTLEEVEEYRQFEDRNWWRQLIEAGDWTGHNDLPGVW